MLAARLRRVAARVVRRTATGGVLALAGVALATAAPAIEPFYLELERQGVAERAAGDPVAAARHLAAACFGMLDEPAARGRCLAELAAARGDAGDREGFQAAFGALLEVERQFQGYSRAILGRDVRDALERGAERWIDRASLADVPAFRSVVRRLEVKAVAALPVAERRAELARRLAAEPQAAGWAVLAAELSLDDGKPTEALTSISPVLARDPEDAGARCVRGRVLAGRGSCPEAEADLARCAPPFGTGTADAIVGCALARGAAARAREVLGELDADLLRRDPFKRHLRELEKLEKDKPHVPVEPATVESASSALPAEPERGSLSPADSATLGKARTALASSSRAELSAGYEAARDVADRNPASHAAQHVAAELAYRLAKWSDAVTLFRRGGEVDGGRPELGFYLAVSLYESGDRNGASVALRAALPGMARTPFVESYVKKILGDGSTRRP